jgi:GT2 family glycosyltransferase
LDQVGATCLLDSLHHVYRGCGVVESCAIIQLPFWRQLALGLRSTFGARVLYDCMDDWETFPGIGAFNLSEERHLAGECDVLVVTAQKLVEKFSPKGLAPLLARNAADFDRFAAPTGEPPLSETMRRPVVGYFGAIADWMDLDLVAEVARLRPQYSFVLIGEVFGRDTSGLKRLPNVHLLGHREYEEIPLYLREFDACMIPFLVNQVTDATDPVKLYEYLSQGKPVVATNMAELASFSELVYIGRDASDFATKLDQAVGEQGETLRERRVEFARANTWVHRVESIDSAVRKTFPLVSVLIVAHNSSEFVRPCIESLLRNTTYPSVEFVFVDNGSTDGTQELLRTYAEANPGFRVFFLEENRGFAGGNNFAAKHASGEYFIFLNADTMATVGWVEFLLRHCRKDRTIGLLTAVTNFAGNEVKIDIDYKNREEMESFAAHLAQAHQGEVFDLDVAPLYCALMPRVVWERVGELDERFEIGMFEDDDLSMRVRAAGLRVAAAADCFIHHFGQGSFSQLAREDYQRIFDRNRRLFEQKWNKTWEPHRPRAGARPAHEEEKFDPRTFNRAR